MAAHPHRGSSLQNRFAALAVDEGEDTGEEILFTGRRRAGREWARSSPDEHPAPAPEPSAPAQAPATLDGDLVPARQRRQHMFDAAALLWVDLEMTGLDASRDHILEIACIITDGALVRSVEGPSIVIHQPEHVLDGMNDWCKEHHGPSGLTQRVRDSTTTLEAAEASVLAFVQRHTPPLSVQLAGNAVYKDKEFLEKYMPSLMAHLHWSIVDVSSVRSLVYRWHPRTLRRAPPKKSSHRALEDIRESIQELRFYKQNVFLATTPRARPRKY